MNTRDLLQRVKKTIFSIYEFEKARRRYGTIKFVDDYLQNPIVTTSHSAQQRRIPLPFVGMEVTRAPSLSNIPGGL